MQIVSGRERVEQHRELVTGETPHQSARVHRVDDASGRDLQTPIAHGVAERVIDVLESVQVHI